MGRNVKDKYYTKKISKYQVERKNNVFLPTCIYARFLADLINKALL